MGRTLFGIDLDDTRTGRIVRGLLDEEELEMLADGGRARDDDTETGEERGLSEDGDVDGSAGTDDGSGSSAREDDHVPTVLDEEVGHAANRSDRAADRDDTGRAADGGDGSESLDEAFEEEQQSRFERLKPLLLKLAAVAAVLAAVGILLYKYGDKIAGAVPGLGGGDEEEDEAGPGYVGDRSPETGGPAPSETPPRATVAPERETADVPDDAGASAERTAAQAGDGSDTGALVGLALLALVAALARKFGEGREGDPLVEGER